MTTCGPGHLRSHVGAVHVVCRKCILNSSGSRTTGCAVASTLRRTVILVDHVDVLRQCGRVVQTWPHRLVSVSSRPCVLRARRGLRDLGYGGYGYGESTMWRCGWRRGDGSSTRSARPCLRHGSPGGVAGRPYVKASTGVKCSLPDRIPTSAARSRGRARPDGFLDKRFTGMGTIDSWLAVVRMAYRPPSTSPVALLRCSRERDWRRPARLLRWRALRAVLVRVPGRGLRGAGNVRAVRHPRPVPPRMTRHVYPNIEVSRR